MLPAGGGPTSWRRPRGTTSYPVLWLDRWLADAGQTAELRQRAARGDEQARERLVLGPGPR